MPDLFEIGQRVVCVNDTFPPGIARLYQQLPKRGLVYVIRDIRLGVNWSDGQRRGDVSLLLIGLVNPKAESRAALERGFSADRFVPLEGNTPALEKSEKKCDLVLTPAGV